MNEKIYIERLRIIVDFVDKLMGEIILVHPEVNGFKRTTKLTSELRTALSKTVPRQSAELIQGGLYIYIPDKLCFAHYKKFSGQVARLIAIGPIRMQTLIYDSNEFNNSFYLIEVVENIGLGGILGKNYHQFYTRKKCLRPYKGN